MRACVSSDVVPVLAADPVHGFRLPGGGGSVEVVHGAAADGGAALAKYTMTVYTGRDMVVGYYGRVVIDLKGLRIPKGDMPAYRDHDSAKVIGHGRARKDGTNVIAEGVISGTGPDAQEVMANAKNGFPWQSSIGVMPERVEEVAAGKSVKVNGLDFVGPLNVIRAGEMYEHSFVPLGADRNARSEIAASAAAGQENSMEFEKWLLAEFGLDAAAVAALTGEQRKKFEAKFEAAKAALEAGKTVPAAPAPAAAAPAPVVAAPALDMVAEARAKLVAERARIDAIRAEFAGFHVDPEAAKKLEAQAVAEGWDIDKTRLALLYAERPKAPAVIVREPSADQNMLKAAFCMSGGMADKPLVANFGDKTLSAARKYRGMGIRDLMRLAAALDGVELPVFAGTGSEFIRAAFSTVSLPGILSDSANKMLLDGYNYVEAVWREVVKIASVRDFKTHTRYRLTDDMKYKKVGPDGELKHGSLGEQSFTNQADTHGIMFSLTRQMIVNDDLGAFAQIPQAFGIGAAEALNDIVWTLVMANAGSFYSTAHANLLEGAAYALSIDGLTAAEQMFLDQTKPSLEVGKAGRPLGIPAKKLVVPTALKTVAEQLYRDTTVNETTTANKPKTAGNPHAGKFAPFCSAYLSNANFTGYSSTAYYLFADPNVLPAFEVAFLNGVDQPTVESADADFNTLGIQFRGYIDFGAAQQDYRGVVKVTGVAAAS